MTSFNSNTIVNRDSARIMESEGIAPRLYTVSSPPPGPWLRSDDGSGAPRYFDLPEEANQAGVMVAVQVSLGGVDNYYQLYVYIDNPYSQEDDFDLWSAWNYWKQVDLDFPKIDPRTGKPFDQYLEWYSPLAQ